MGDDGVFRGEIRPVAGGEMELARAEFMPIACSHAGDGTMPRGKVPQTAAGVHTAKGRLPIAGTDTRPSTGGDACLMWVEATAARVLFAVETTAALARALVAVARRASSGVGAKATPLLPVRPRPSGVYALAARRCCPAAAEHSPAASPASSSPMLAAVLEETAVVAPTEWLRVRRAAGC